MEPRRKNICVFFIKIFRCVLSPRKRLRKCLRKSAMKQMKISVVILIVSTCLITLVLCYLHRNTQHRHSTTLVQVVPTTDRYIIGTPMSHVNLKELYKDRSKKDNDYSLEVDEEFLTPALLLDMPGCKIPFMAVKYEYTFLNRSRKRLSSCGRRAVYLTKHNTDQVKILIKPMTLRGYFKNKSAVFDCCHRFFEGTHRAGKLRFNSCKKFTNEEIIPLESDFINVRCFEYDKKNRSQQVYDDMYAFVKKVNRTKTNDCKEKYNILMLGIDSMSLFRFVQTMPRTTNYFSENSWLQFRGYHKVDDNTFPNLMASLTGKNLSTIAKSCADKMDQCKDLLIWNKFEEIGYVTAFGEDYVRLPDTFTRTYAFQEPPTHHYMRPFFLKGETYTDQLVCAGNLPSGQHLLNYAFDFANTYRSESFFGLFWMNTLSHNENSHPEAADLIFENFLNQISYTGLLLNTFIIIFSDHGIRFGKKRSQVESYYDERMPTLFMWAPVIFKGNRFREFEKAAINQFALLTPYDIYNTMLDIHRISRCNISTLSIPYSDSCPNCQSIFDVVNKNRTCRDVMIGPKWCSCHKMFPLELQDYEGRKAVNVAVAYIKTLVQSIQTKHCWRCMNLELSNVTRIHFYYDDKRTTLYYVLAFTMTPNEMSYEATVQRVGQNISLVGPVSVISLNLGLGHCAIKRLDRRFCKCVRIQNCT